MLLLFCWVAEFPSEECHCHYMFYFYLMRCGTFVLLVDVRDTSMRGVFEIDIDFCWKCQEYGKNDWMMILTCESLRPSLSASFFLSGLLMYFCI